ncbi:hypothetical protein HAX54_013731 [Datura stramonium]|uniref:non-specific serine/threonine protein kinase n=1 Tax=Datura stramonium TaxID=4076 RepID=A0ABS8Y5S8_DATST|nr:hypothetical protein [Datura stramonium]
MIPRTTKLCEYLRNPVNEKDGISMFSGVFSHWHGLRDGLFGLLDIRLKKEGPLAVQHSCASGIPQILIDLLTGNITEASSEESNFPKDQIGLSPIGVPWSISLLCQCLTGGVSTFRHIFLKMEHAKFISYLILDVHLKLVKSWSGPGGRADGVRDTINTVIDLLAFPFVAVQNGLGLPSATASVNSGFLLNVGSPGGRVCPEDKDMIKAIESHLGKYTQILLEIGNAAYHNELLYDELRRSIPQLSYLLLSAEEDKTKANAAGALSNLVRNSNKLCEDIVSKGAMQVFHASIMFYLHHSLFAWQTKPTYSFYLRRLLFLNQVFSESYHFILVSSAWMEMPYALTVCSILI